MDQPTHPVLQQIRDLDSSSADFHHQLDNILHGLEYEKCVESLEGDDLVWFVEYLDKVCGLIVHCSPALKPSL